MFIDSNSKLYERNGLGKNISVFDHDSNSDEHSGLGFGTSQSGQGVLEDSGDLKCGAVHTEPAGSKPVKIALALSRVS